MVGFIYLGEMDGERLILKAARMSDKDSQRLRTAGDALPHRLYANPALTAAKARGVSLADTGRPTPIAPIILTEDELRKELGLSK